MFDRTRWLTIARNTFLESIRQPIYLVVLVLGILMLLMAPPLSGFTLGSASNKLLMDMGLSAMLLSGVVLAAFTATGVLSEEIERQTALTVISKPISRPAFAVGKYLGVLAALALAYWIWSIIFLLEVRHTPVLAERHAYDLPVLIFGFGALLVALGLSLWGNFFYRWVFPSTFVRMLAVALTVAYALVVMVSKDWRLQNPLLDRSLDPAVLTAVLFVFEALMIFCAIALACSTRLRQVMTLVICLAVFLVGVANQSIFQPYASEHWAARAAYSILPNIQFHWIAGGLTKGIALSPAELFTLVGTVTAYTLLYTLAVLLLAIALFQTREAS